MNAHTTVIVADDHPLFREGVIRTLSAAPDIDVVAEAEDAVIQWIWTPTATDN